MDEGSWSEGAQVYRSSVDSDLGGFDLGIRFFAEDRTVHHVQQVTQMTELPFCNL